MLYDNVNHVDEALEKLRVHTYDCIVVDIDGNVTKGINDLAALRDAAGSELYFIVYLDDDISSADEMALKKYAESIIRKSSHATDRLLDEVELFLHKVKTTPQTTAAVYHDKVSDKLLEGKKVLLADDDMRNIFALNALLEEQGMIIINAENGKEALEQLQQNPDVDIVLMDIMMPEMDGYEAMRLIRADKKYRRLPVIALTAKAMAGDREMCIEAGASDYITKPVNSSKLFSLMRVWLSQ